LETAQYTPRHVFLIKCSREAEKWTSASPWQAASVKEQFKECSDRAAAALTACPDSLVLRLLFAEVCYDNPFCHDDDLATLK
jgi:hypothetical protein